MDEACEREQMIVTLRLLSSKVQCRGVRMMLGNMQARYIDYIVR